MRKSSSSPTPLLTVEDAAPVLKVSRSKMYELIRNGLPTLKIDGKRRILPTALAAWPGEWLSWMRQAQQRRWRYARGSGLSSPLVLSSQTAASEWRRSLMLAEVKHLPFVPGNC